MSLSPPRKVGAEAVWVPLCLVDCVGASVPSGPSSGGSISQELSLIPVQILTDVFIEA